MSMRMVMETAKRKVLVSMVYLAVMLIHPPLAQTLKRVAPMLENTFLRKHVRMSTEVNSALYDFDI